MRGLLGSAQGGNQFLHSQASIAASLVRRRLVTGIEVPRLARGCITRLSYSSKSLFFSSWTLESSPWVSPCSKTPGPRPCQLLVRLTMDPREVRRTVHHEADVVVVGAGILGCAIAVALGKQGRSVILLEKSLKEPERIVGELLQPGGVAALEALGIRGWSDCRGR